MPSRNRLWLSIGCGLFSAACGAWAAGRSGPLTTAELLVQLARDHGLSQRGQQTAADVQQVRTLLKAAVRLDPAQTDAYVWLYELAMLSGDRAEAARMLTGLLSANPVHQGAFALWLEAGVRAKQTAEERAEWLEAVLASRRPPAMQAMVHVELARLALERMDSAEAQRQVARALELEPASPEAATLTLALLDEDAAPAERLRAMLRVLRVRPLSLEAAWQVGLILDEYGFAEEAKRFYEHARDVQHKANPHGSLPGGCLLDLARNRLGCARLDKAIEHARQAVASDPHVRAEAGMFLHYLLTRKGRRVEAAKVREQLAKRFAPLSDPDEWPVNEVAQAAWFYCTISADPHRAAMLAKAAAERAPGDVFVQRTLGWAQALNLKPEEARRTLAPIADRDAYAAYLLARLLHEESDDLGAMWVVDNLEPMPRSGPAFDLLSAMGSGATASQPVFRPAKREYPEIRKALEEFDDEVLKFHQTPGRFLEARVTLEDLGPAPGDPWWATLSLTNRGTFPITLGPEAMVNPVFLLSFTLEGDRERAYPALTTVSVDQVRVLYPGQTTRVRRTIDVGPIRRVSRQTPQQAQRIIVQVVLDAEMGADGQWRPGPGGQQLPPVYFNRLPAATGRAAIAALFSVLAGESQTSRARVVELLAELLGERQRAELNRLSYKPEGVPVGRLRAALLNLLSSESWELRVRTLDALQVVGLDRQMVAAVERSLAHHHWLVRMMAVRVLARQGQTFAERAGSIARNDSDELVRALAESYVLKWGEVTTQETDEAAR